MMGLTDYQMKIVMHAAGAMPSEKRDLYLQRIAAMLRLRGRFADSDIADVVRLAGSGLVLSTRGTAPNADQEEQAAPSH